MSPPSLSDSSRKISTDAEAGFGPLNSGGGVPFLVVSVFHSALWVTDHSLGLNGNSMLSSSLIPPPAFGSRMVSDALRMLSRVDGGTVSAPGGGRGRLDEAVVRHLQGLVGDLGRLDVEGRARPFDGDHAVEAPRHDLLVVGTNSGDGRCGAAHPGGHAGQPLGHLGAVGTDRPAELDVGVLEPAGELVDELVVAALLARLDRRLHAQALEAVPQAQLVAVDLDLEGVGNRRVARHVLGHFSSSLVSAAGAGTQPGTFHVAAQLRAHAPADPLLPLVGELLEVPGPGRPGPAAGAGAGADGSGAGAGVVPLPPPPPPSLGAGKTIWVMGTSPPPPPPPPSPAPGTPGMDGSEGMAGICGSDGAKGIGGSCGRGIAGSDGIAGIDGSDGIAGIAGSDGKDGLVGSEGRCGRPGILGTPGSCGTNGMSGSEPSEGIAGAWGRLGRSGIALPTASRPRASSPLPASLARSANPRPASRTDERSGQRCTTGPSVGTDHDGVATGPASCGRGTEGRSEERPVGKGGR